jgi:uncharacterized protein YrrD
VGLTLKTFANTKGLPIIDVNTGEQLGIVEDLCFEETGKVSGVVMDARGLKRDKVIPITSVQSFGSDGVMVDQSKVFRNKSRADHLLHESHEGLIGKALMSKEGDKLGLVEDVYFREELGTIVGYEVTEGFFADIREGRKIVKAASPLTVGKKTAIIDLKT